MGTDDCLRAEEGLRGSFSECRTWCFGKNAFDIRTRRARRSLGLLWRRLSGKGKQGRRRVVFRERTELIKGHLVILEVGGGGIFE